MSHDKKAWKESIRRIYPGDSTEYVTVAPDADGLGLTEVILHDNDSGKRLAEMRFGPVMGPLVAEAIVEVSQGQENTQPERTAKPGIDVFLNQIREAFEEAVHRNGGVAPDFKFERNHDSFEIDFN